LSEATGEVIGSERKDFQAAFEKRDREIALLRRELRMLRDEVALKLSLKSELAEARAEIAELRSQSPDFKAELADLRERTEKQARLIVRLRSEQSQLSFGLRQVEVAQQKDRRETSLTVTKMTAFGERTSEVLRQLCEEAGFNLTGAGYEQLN
jgi:chromosome segregation ATPase